MSYVLCPKALKLCQLVSQSHMAIVIKSQQEYEPLRPAKFGSSTPKGLVNMSNLRSITPLGLVNMSNLRSITPLGLVYFQS